MLTQLKARRLQQNISQAAAAERLKMGVSAYSLIESGRMRPSPAQVQALEEAFGCAVQALLDPISDLDGI